MVMRFLKWYWYWLGPQSPMGPIPAGALTGLVVVSLVVVLLRIL